MKTGNRLTLPLTLLLAVLGLNPMVIPTARAVPGGDDFNSSVTDRSKWAPGIVLSPPGQLAQTNGRLYLLGNGTGLWPWIGSYGSYTQDWEMIADVNVGNITLTRDDSNVEVFLGVGNLNDTGIQYGIPGDNFYIRLNLKRDPYGITNRNFEAHFQTNMVEVGSSVKVNTVSLQASLRVSFAAATKSLSAWYDPDGSANGYSWTLLRSAQVNVPASDWGMDDHSAFEFIVGAAADQYTVSTADQVYADNFVVNGGVALGATLFDNPGNFIWARRLAGTGLPNDELAIGLAMDAATNLYVTGWFDGTNDFGGTTLASYGGQDAFVARYDANGALQWVRQMGGMDVEPMDTDYWDNARGVGVDGAGNVYVTGGFLGAATFSGTVLTSLNLQDAFLAKYNAAGTLQWVRQAGDSVHAAYGTGLAVDSAGNSLCIGYFDGQTVSFGGITATNPGYAGGAYAAFLAKYNSAGTVQWARGLGGGSTYSTTVGMDAAGNCYVAGGFDGTLQLGVTNLTSTVDKDGFLAKYNSAGVLQWVRQVKGSSMDGGRLGVDPSGNCFLVGGVFSGVLDFGGMKITNTSVGAIYLARYDTSGGLQWVRTANNGTGYVASEGGAAIDSGGNCYLPCGFNGSVNFGGTVVTNRGGGDVLVAKYDAAGNFKWAQTAGGAGDDGGLRLVPDNAGNCYVAGWFQHAAAFGTNLLQAREYRDGFLARLGPPATSPMTPTLHAAWSNNLPQLLLGGAVGYRYAIEYVGSLAPVANWQGLGTNLLTNNPQLFPDPTASSATKRFYRARWAP